MKKSKVSQTLPANKMQLEHIEKEIVDTEESAPEKPDSVSIQEFIELKKLQNKILKKMLEKINESENKNQ